MSTWVFKTQKYLQDLKSIQSKNTHTVAVTEHKTHKNKNKPMYEITFIERLHPLHPAKELPTHSRCCVSISKFSTTQPTEGNIAT